MIPNFSTYENKEVKDLQNKLITTLKLLGIENFRNVLMEGRTASTADTERKMFHGLNTKPWGTINLGGDIYIKDITDQYVDVRSGILNAPFKIYLLG